MGDFTDIVNAVPEFTKPGVRESFVDAQGLEIIRVTPMDGSAALFISSVQVTTTQGPMTVQFPIVAASIEEAIAKWQESARTALRAFAEKMREAQRRIVLPGNPAANSAPFKRIIN